MLLLDESVSVTLGGRDKVILALEDPDDALMDVDLAGGAGAFLSSLDSAALLLFDLRI